MLLSDNINHHDNIAHIIWESFTYDVSKFSLEDSESLIIL